MIRVDAQKAVHFCDGMTRRDFLHAGSLAFLGLSMPEFFALQAQGAVKSDLPPHVLIPRPIGNTGGNMPHGQNAGYLGRAYDPFYLNSDPSTPDFKVPDMLPPDYISAIRADRRQKLRTAVDQTVAYLEK